MGRWRAQIGALGCLDAKHGCLCALETIFRYTVQAFCTDRGVGIGRHVFRQGECQLVGGERGDIVQPLPLDHLDASEFAVLDGRDVTLSRHDGGAGRDVLLLGRGGQLGRLDRQFV